MRLLAERDQRAQAEPYSKLVKSCHDRAAAISAARFVARPELEPEWKCSDMQSLPLSRRIECMAASPSTVCAAACMALPEKIAMANTKAPQ